MHTGATWLCLKYLILHAAVNADVIDPREAEGTLDLLGHAGGLRHLRGSGIDALYWHYVSHLCICKIPSITAHPFSARVTRREGRKAKLCCSQHHTKAFRQACM